MTAGPQHDERVAGPEDEGVPPGWALSPSGWPQRLPIVVAALIGLGASGWLTLYQDGVTDVVWEPFFDDGTREIVRESGFSRWFNRNLPVGDAFLGASVYLADAVTGSIGGPGRWRRMPWLIALFTVFVVVLGIVSVGLVVLQPVLYGAFCTLCIVSAGASLSMVGPALDEVLATLQHLGRVRLAGGSIWRAFWGLPATTTGAAEAVGEAREAEPTVRRRPETQRTGRAAGPVPATILRLVAVAVGAWLMFAPAVLGYDGRAASNDRIFGPLIASLSFVALWELGRALRWVTLPLGGWLVVAPLVLWYGDVPATVNSVICGLLVVVTAPLPPAGGASGAIDPFAERWRAVLGPPSTTSH